MELAQQKAKQGWKNSHKVDILVQENHMFPPAHNLWKLTSGLIRQNGGQKGYYDVQPHTMDVASGPYKINAFLEPLSGNCVVESAH